jgi:hypothetical protein
LQQVLVQFRGVFADRVAPQGVVAESANEYKRFYDFSRQLLPSLGI